jgi:hypothetical protein
MSRYPHAAAVIAAFVALGCGTTQVRTDRDPDVNLASYRTFEVQQGQVIAQGMVDPRDTLVHDRVQSALQSQLEGKGLTETAQDPDLIATYTARGREVLDVDDDWDEYARTGFDRGAYPQQKREGTLVLDLIDAKTNKLVWRSIVEVDNDDLRSAKTIDKAVDKGLERYPGPLGTE